MRNLLRSPATVVAGIVLGAGIGACAFQRAQEAADAQVSMVGMAKEQVLACMGPPEHMGAVGATEVWTYASGNGQTDSFGTATAFGGRFSASAFGSAESTSRFCKVNIVMNEGRVSKVSYIGPTGGLFTKGEQCAFAVDACIQQTATKAPAQQPQVSTEPQANDALRTQPVMDEPEPQATCSAQDKEIAQLAKKNGYSYDQNCT